MTSVCPLPDAAEPEVHDDQRDPRRVVPEAASRLGSNGCPASSFNLPPWPPAGGFEGPGLASALRYPADNTGMLRLPVFDGHRSRRLAGSAEEVALG